MFLIYTKMYFVLHGVDSWKTIKVPYDIEHKRILKSMS